MAVILTILKIIGILLLAILLLLLAAVLLVLFVPIRYRAEGSYLEKPDGKARVSWMFGLLQARAAYAEGLSWGVFLFGIQLLPRKEKAGGGASKKRRKRAGRKKTPKPAAAAEEKIPDRPEAEISVDGNTDEPEIEASAGGSIGEPKAEAGAGRTAQAEAERADAQQVKAEVQQAKAEAEGTAAPEEALQRASGGGEEPKPGLLDRLRALFFKCKSQFLAICDTIKNIREHLDYYKGVFARGDTKRALRAALSALGGILRHVRPRRLQIRAAIGTGDPASTGQILAIQGMLYPWLRDHVVIAPDFEKKRLEGDFFLAGHILPCVLLVKGLQILLNRDIRRLLQLLRKKEEA